MFKAKFLVMFWTLAIAIPATALALSLAAFLTENTRAIRMAVASLNEATTVGGRGWALVFAERWPEVAGIIVGQLVILVILVYARKVRQDEE